MEIPKEILDKVIELSNKEIQNYNRVQTLSNEEVMEDVIELYDFKKTVKWVDNVHEVKHIISRSDKPWAYHYSLNLNWVLFYRTLCRRIWPYLTIEERRDILPSYSKVKLLRKIFDHVDGLVEDGEMVYIIKSDFNFIKSKLDRWKI